MAVAGASPCIRGQEPLCALCLGLCASGNPLPGFQMPTNLYFISVFHAPSLQAPDPSRMVALEIGNMHKAIGVTEAEERKTIAFLLHKAATKESFYVRF